MPHCGIYCIQSFAMEDRLHDAPERLFREFTRRQMLQLAVTANSDPRTVRNEIERWRYDLAPRSKVGKRIRDAIWNFGSSAGAAA